MVLCIQQRSLSLFGGFEVKSTIWPYANTIEQKLYDKGFIFSSVLEDFDKVISSEPTNETADALKALFDRFQSLDREYTLWLSEMADSNESWNLFLANLPIH